MAVRLLSPPDVPGMGTAGHVRLRRSEIGARLIGRFPDSVPARKTEERILAGAQLFLFLFGEMASFISIFGWRLIWVSSERPRISPPAISRLPVTALRMHRARTACIALIPCRSMPNPQVIAEGWSRHTFWRRRKFCLPVSSKAERSPMEYRSRCFFNAQSRPSIFLRIPGRTDFRR